jgi:hypothetical protein
LIEQESRVDFGMTVGMLTIIVVVFFPCMKLSLPDSNTLTGSIPTEIGLLKSLSELNLGMLIEHGRRVDFGIDVGMLTIIVDFCPCIISEPDSNELIGSIPTEIGLLTSLSKLNLGKLIEHERRVDFGIDVGMLKIVVDFFPCIISFVVFFPCTIFL